MEPKTASTGVLFVRYGIGTILVIAGIVLLAVNPGGFGIDGFAMADGAGLSVLMLNFLFRLGVSGDEERQQEEQAREYLEKHGHWPDQAPVRPAPPAAPADGQPLRAGHRERPTSEPHVHRSHEPGGHGRGAGLRERRRGD